MEEIAIDESKVSRVAAWLTGAFAAHPDVRHVQLSQRTLKASGEPSFSPVFQWPRTSGDAPAIARAVVEAATTDAEDTGGLCRYSITAETQGGAVKQRMDLRMNSAKGSGDVAPEDPPTAAGLVGQAMRHQEAGAKLALESVGMVFGLMEKMLGVQNTQIERYQAREERVMEMAERLSGADHERKLEITRTQATAEMRSKAIEKLGPLVPAVMAKLLKLPPSAVAGMSAQIAAAGAGAKPGALGPGSAVASGSAAAAAVSQSMGTAPEAEPEEMDRFLLSFAPEQLPAIAGALTDEQKQRLVHLFQGAQERKEAREMAAASPANPNPAGEATT